MRKTDKKIDNAVIEVLTEVCKIGQQHYTGFMWITHFVDYTDFPKSLSVVCVFDTNEQLKKTAVNELRKLINEKLLSINIKLTDIHGQVSFDTEENCSNQNNGNWDERFK
jgi:hypothetical protein